ncbi:mechanosensitive ion channel family protein [Algoriphagus formosus]|jgi:small conductance mechanosensitive channel|uniref:Mechanosensitive ion channel n=1 Tax=Algoriphagus formosus TaxID=2007308 RepID=A0A4R5V123_9BACT|nr:mechanosensitive ion channel domain-containing protein [Algoriphagus aquimaris]TDK45443.1 mechanosensitive ion channel [Algoriphagus aquimaris]
MEITPEMVDSLIAQGIDLVWLIIPKLIYAALFYLVGRFIIGKILKGFNRVLEKRDKNPSLNDFLSGVVKAALYVSLFIGIATVLGVPLTSFVAILGAAGLAIGLSLQGSLSNFAGGVLILVFKPFKSGDVIVAQGHTGVVKQIGIIYTRMTTFDNKEIIIPNGGLANSDVVNMSTQETRRADLTVGVAYGTNIKVARETILDIFKNDKRVHQDPEPVVFLNNFGDSSLDLVVRAWTDAGDLWPVYFDTMEAINTAFEEKGIEIPFPQRVVHQGKD